MMFLNSIRCGYQIFDLDDKLSKFKTVAVEGEAKTPTHAYMEKKVEEALARLNVPFERQPRVGGARGYGYRADFSISKSGKVKFFIEVRLTIPSDRIHLLEWQEHMFKLYHPDAKTILVTNLSTFPDKPLRRWNYVVDINDLDTLRDIIKIE